MGLIAGEMTNRRQADVESNPDGEGWAFHAAENGMSSYEYTIAQNSLCLGRVFKEIDKVDAVILEDLKDRFDVDESKATSFRTYTKEDFPGLSEEIISSLLKMLHPPEPSCSHCNEKSHVEIGVRVVSADHEDDGTIPF